MGGRIFSKSLITEGISRIVASSHILDEDNENIVNVHN